jgi:hypothetical protein
MSHRLKSFGHKGSSAILVAAFALAGAGSIQAGEKGATTSRTSDGTRLTGAIDQQILQKLNANGIPTSPRADDAEFLRRAYLDIAGVIPAPEKAAAFLDNKDAAKRAQLVDELLASTAYGRHMADIWTTLLIPKNSDNRRLRNEPMRDWLEEAFNKDRPWDKVVTDLITASGTEEENGAVTFFIANPTVDKMTDDACRLFLGVQLQCAQCHNHPFTAWKQTEYWGMAAFFTKVRLQNAGKKAAKNQNAVNVTEEGRGRPKLPDSAKIVPAKFLGGAEPRISTSDPARPVLAAWVTAPDNPFFARAMTNRMWAQFFGRGLVHPVDDIRDDNPGLYPELFKELSDGFAASGFDLKQLIRAICASEAYNRTSKPNAKNAADGSLFSHMTVKVLSPEQLYDSLTAVHGSPLKMEEKGGKGAAVKGKLNNGRDAFVAFFGVGDDADPTEYQAGIPQALRLMNSNQFAGGHLLTEASKAKTQAGVVEELYLGTLSRRPTAAEHDTMAAYVRKHKDPKDASADILWALLNSSEFTLNH